MRVGIRTLLIAVVGLSAIAIAVSGCTGDSDAEAETPPATTTGQVETQPPARSAVDIAKFRAAFEETFGERPWYGQITGMKMAQITTTKKAYRTLEITMTLDPESEIDVGTICEAAFTVAHNLGVRDGIEAVRVMGSDGADGGCA
jgi:hypothetical protein